MFICAHYFDTGSSYAFNINLTMHCPFCVYLKKENSIIKDDEWCGHFVRENKKEKGTYKD